MKTTSTSSSDSKRSRLVVQYLASALPAVGSPAKRQAVAILEVLAGVLRPAEAAQLLEISLPRYYLWEKRALAGLLAACSPAPRGPCIDASRQLAALERENRRLQRECDRQQALVRAAERALGLARLSLVKSSAKSKEESQGGNGKRRRRVRRPTVRALKASQTLRREAAVEASPGLLAVEATSSATTST